MGIAIPQVVTEDRASGAQIIDGSLKFDSSKSQHLTRTFAVGNRTTWTWSSWVKRGNIPTNNIAQALFGAYSDGTNRDVIRINGESQDTLSYQNGVSGDYDSSTTSALLRDTGWYHFVISYDSNQETQTNKVKIYVNGELQSKSNDAQTARNSVVNGNYLHFIGARSTNGTGSAFLDGSMSQVYFIDGQALGPESFGFTDPLTNTWRPKKYEGTFTQSSVNDGTTWSSSLTSNGTLQNAGNAFDGDLSSRAQTAGAAADKNLTFAPPAINFTQKLEVYCDQGSAVPTAIWNGNTVNPGGGAWVTVYTGSGTLSSTYPLVIDTETAGQYATLKGVRIDGEVLIDGLNGSGVNSFYLPMDGNSPIGKDLSNPNPINDGTTWSSGGTNNWDTSNPIENGFNGITSSDVSGGMTRPTNANVTATWNAPAGGIPFTTLKLRAARDSGSYANAIKINDVDVTSQFTASTATLATVTITGVSSPLTKLELTAQSGVAQPRFTAIYIDDVILIDDMYGNSWTPVKFGGSVALDNPIVSGASPILNTDGGGNVARPDVRTDRKTYTVTASSGNYYIDGALKPTLSAYRGGAYTFDYTGATSHPFYLSSLSDGKWNSKAYSTHFDGNDTLKVSSTNIPKGSSARTVDFWVWISSGYSSWSNIFAYGGASDSQCFGINIDNSQSGEWSFTGYSNGDYNTGVAVTPYVDKWTHVAVTYAGGSGGALKVYLNGSLIGSTTKTLNTTGSTFCIGGSEHSGFGENFTGYIADFRVTSGVLYTDNFTPPNTSITTTSQGATASDVALLCCQNQTVTTAVKTPDTISVSGDPTGNNTYHPYLFNNVHGNYGLNTATSNTTKITIPHWAADTLYYYCNAHSGMGSSINVTTDILKADPYAWKNVLALPLIDNGAGGTTQDFSNQINIGSTTKASTTTGNTDSTSAQSVFYNRSYVLDGTNDDIRVPDDADFTFGFGDFTLECWAHQTSNSSWRSLIQKYVTDNASSSWWWAYLNGIQYFYIYHGGSSTALTAPSTYTVPANTWVHCAITRSGNTFRMFQDGIQIATMESPYAMNDSAGRVAIGQDGGADYDFAGYFSDVRIYNGVAKYTSDFVVPTTNPDILPDTPSGVSGGSKLAKITEGAVGGLETTSDYLSLAASSDFEFTGDHTIEFFVYHNTLANASVPYSTGGSGQPDQIYIGADGICNYGYGQTGVVSAPAGTIGVGRWQHIAVSKQGTNLRMFVDGIIVASSTNHSSTIGSSSNGPHIGARRDGYHPTQGFISNLRIIKGTALYTANFTPPTRELTNVTNTKLLCCQSNTSAGAAAVSPSISGINDGTVWSDGADPALDNFNGIQSIFDGSLTTRGGDTNTAYLTYVNNVSISASTGIRIYWNGVGSGQRYIRINGTTELDDGSGQLTPGWSSVSSFSGTINKIEIKTANSGSFGVAAIEIDGTILIDPVTANGGAAATNFNPFTTDIDAVRGQETGYATLNPLSLTKTLTLSDGNLGYTATSAENNECFSNMRLNGGKFYFESNLINAADVPGSTSFRFGICKNLDGVSGSNIIIYNATGNFETFGTTDSSPPTYTAGNTIGVSVDCVNGSIQFFKDGVSVGTKTFTVGTDEWTSYIRIYKGGGNTVNGTINFGQKPFKFPPPDGFQPLNAANVRPETVISRPDQFVKTSLYTGSGPSTPVEVNLGFQPDLVWSKSRTQTYNHYLHDSVRGSNNFLNSNTADAETVNAANDKLTFTSTGYTVNANSGALNESGQGADNMVSWSWKAGGNKNTFNVDDVGYASAADVNMSVGALNSSVYNQDAWNSQVTGVDYSWAGSATNGMFDGLNNKIRAAGSGSSFTWNTSIAASTLRVKVHNEGGASGNGGTFTVTDSNGTRAFAVPNSTNADVTNGVLQFTNVPVSGTLTQIVCNGGVGGYQSGIGMVEINGKILLDSGATLPDTPSMVNTGASVGTKQGFSIIKYNHNQNSSQTLAHGLTQTPQFIMDKRLKSGTTTNWDVYHASAPNAETGRLLLNSTGAYSNEDGPWNDTAPNSSVFTVGPNGWKGDGDHIVYLWHDVPGVQKFGSYTGNGAQNFVSLDFRPAIVWVKRAVVNSSPDSGSTHSSWTIMDSARLSYNGLTPNHLYANKSINEGYRGSGSGASNADITLEPLSNGFYINGPGTETNANTGTYIYCAWAEAPTFNLYGAQSNAR